MIVSCPVAIAAVITGPSIELRLHIHIAYVHRGNAVPHVVMGYRMWLCVTAYAVIGPHWRLFRSAQAGRNSVPVPLLLQYETP